jgi:hypothetical protein
VHQQQLLSKAHAWNAVQGVHCRSLSNIQPAGYGYKLSAAVKTMFADDAHVCWHCIRWAQKGQMQTSEHSQACCCTPSLTGQAAEQASGSSHLDAADMPLAAEPIELTESWRSIVRVLQLKAEQGCLLLQALLCQQVGEHHDEPITEGSR